MVAIKVKYWNEMNVQQQDEDLTGLCLPLSCYFHAPEKPVCRTRLAMVTMTGSKLHNQVFIAVMGVTGSGKSTFIRTATGDETIPIGMSMKSCVYILKTPYSWKSNKLTVCSNRRYRRRSSIQIQARRV